MGDTGLWLPSQFLAGDGEGDMKNSDKSLANAFFGFPSEFPYEFGVSSPAVESVAGSTETESSDGEEDFFAGLTRRLSQSSLHETRKQLTAVPVSDVSTFSEIPRKTRGLVGSPQSTLTGIGSWSGRSAISGDGSPTGSGLLTRPRPNGPNQSFNQVQEQVRPKQQCGSVWGRPAKPNWLVQQQQLLQVRSRARCTRPLCLPQSVWSPLQVQQQNNNRVQFGGSGSRVVVPGGSSVKRGCAGTGVFLPRHYEAPSEPRKKTGCAPVLLPAKVVHALNLSIDDLNGTSQQRFSNAFATDYDAILARRNALLMQQRLSVRREDAANYEIRLPQEWTY
ncbi:hypothetical protein E2542_SST29551 [Spatholobus suberectus]|nr:hypothetical protein E2542_SST29551 [Spatholobus suberectus]